MDLSGWNVEEVTTITVQTSETNIGGLFQGCSNLENLDISTWNLEKVTDMRHMFYGCSKLSSINLQNCNFSQVTQSLNMITRSNTIVYVKDIESAKFIDGVKSNLIIYYGNPDNCTRYVP